ncbi:MAG TPA: OmpA family protein [Labilithrix sp.]|nr:OmpA family protein [Labilithrix sp.]
MASRVLRCAAAAIALAACAEPKPILKQPVGSTTVTGSPELPTDFSAGSRAREEVVAPPRPEAGGEPCPELLPSFMFEPDSALISTSQNDALRHLAQCLASERLKDKMVIAIGHTDAAGDTRHNLALGLDRAVKVRDFLVSHGLAPERILAATAGELSTAASPAGRRVDLRMLATSPRDERRRPAPIEAHAF